MEAQQRAMAIPVKYGRRGGKRLFEQLLRRDREPVRDVRRAVGDFEQVIAERATMLADAPMPRRELDAAKASGADLTFARLLAARS
jgi:hypothetical protein